MSCCIPLPSSSLSSPSSSTGVVVDVEMEGAFCEPIAQASVQPQTPIAPAAGTALAAGAALDPLLWTVVPIKELRSPPDELTNCAH